MFPRISKAILIAGGAVVVSACFCGCANQPGGSNPAVDAQAPEPVAQSPQAPAAAPQSAPTATPAAQPDEASLLANKTSEYAKNVGPLLAQQGSNSRQPSMVQWVDPSTRPSEPMQAPAPVQPAQDQGPAANQPASLGDVPNLKQDTSVPLILPESADQLPPSGQTSTSAAQNASVTQTPDAGSGPVAVSTDEYEQRLRKLVQDYPQDLGNQLDYQLLRLVRDEPSPDLTDVSQLSEEDRNLLMVVMDGLSNFRTAARGNGNMMLNSKIQPLIEMADRLRSQASLAIPTVAFCSQVASFGVYRPMASSKFPLGVESPIIVYNEVGNFTSVQDNNGIWHTRLKQEMVLYSDAGLAVWPDQSNAATFVDQSRNLRHDFFISRKIVLPSSLAEGRYVLKIMLTDEQSNRVVEASAPLEIVTESAPSEPEPAADQSTPDSEPLSP
jgi:hypothetical protein